MAEDKRPQSPTFKPIMAGLAVGSGIFLLERFLLKLDESIALPVATFFAIFAGMMLFHWQQNKDKQG